MISYSCVNASAASRMVGSRFSIRPARDLPRISRNQSSAYCLAWGGLLPLSRRETDGLYRRPSTANSDFYFAYRAGPSRQEFRDAPSHPPMKEDDPITRQCVLEVR